MLSDEHRLTGHEQILQHKPKGYLDLEEDGMNARSCVRMDVKKIKGRKKHKEKKGRREREAKE
jgi:hypothetical protein